MSAPSSDLDDRAARAAYRREMHAVARPIRLMGVALAVFGLGVALAHRIWPQVPSVIAVFLLFVAALHLLAGFVIRLRFHRERMRGQVPPFL